MKNLTKEEIEFLKAILESVEMSDIVSISEILVKGKWKKINSEALFTSIMEKLQNILKEK